MKKTWVVAADCCRARIFMADRTEHQLTEIQTLSHPASRLHEGDLITDTAEGEPCEHKQDEAERFAADVCSELERSRKNGEFEKLYLVAAPTFLGQLRKHQSTAVKQMLAGEFNKNLTTHSVAEIRGQLPQYL